jgi:hypothetical protein
MNFRFTPVLEMFASFAQQKPKNLYPNKDSMTDNAPGFSLSPSCWSTSRSLIDSPEEPGKERYQSDVDEGTIPAYTSFGGKGSSGGGLPGVLRLVRRTLAFWAFR